MPKFVGAPRLVKRRTYIDGKFRGKFRGGIDESKSDLLRENFYDLEFLSGEIDAKSTSIRNWREGELDTFRKVEQFPTRLLNPLNCNLRYPDGGEKHFKIELHEPKILKPDLIKQVYEGSEIFTTVEGRISGYLTHYDLAGTVVEVPQAVELLPSTATVQNGSSSAAGPSARERLVRDSVKGGAGRGASGGEAAKLNSRSGGPHIEENRGCLDSGTNGCLSGCGSILAVLLGLFMVSAMIGWIAGWFRDPLTTQQAALTPAPVTIQKPVPRLPELDGSGPAPRSDLPEPTPPEVTYPDNEESDSDVGRLGEFKTNEHLRSDPNMFATSVAVHFKGARFRVAEQEIHVTGAGTRSKWYKVEVIEYGCDVENILGCGKGMPDDSDTGWLNSKYVTLDK